MFDSVCMSVRLGCVPSWGFDLGVSWLASKLLHAASPACVFATPTAIVVISCSYQGVISRSGRSVRSKKAALMGALVMGVQEDSVHLRRVLGTGVHDGVLQARLLFLCNGCSQSSGSVSADEAAAEPRHLGSVHVQDCMAAACHNKGGHELNDQLIIDSCNGHLVTGLICFLSTILFCMA